MASSLSSLEHTGLLGSLHSCLVWKLVYTPALYKLLMGFLSVPFIAAVGPLRGENCQPTGCVYKQSVQGMNESTLCF